MKAGIANSLSARCAGACPSARTKLRKKKRRTAGAGRSVRRFPQKWGGRRENEGSFARKSTSFRSASPYNQKNETFPPQKIRPFETKFLLLRLIKHNFPFIPPHCGVYIAQSRGTFPDPPAQTLFDLLNPSRLCLIPAYRNMPQRRSPSQSGDIGTTAIRAPWGLYGKKEEQRPVFLPQEKGHSLSWTTRFGQAHSFLVLPTCGESDHHYLILGVCFLKKKARSPIP